MPFMTAKYNICLRSLLLVRVHKPLSVLNYDKLGIISDANDSIAHWCLSTVGVAAKLCPIPEVTKGMLWHTYINCSQTVSRVWFGIHKL